MLTGAGLLSCSLWLGCASQGSQTAPASPEGEAPAPAAAAEVAAPAALELTGITLREAAPGARIELAADGPLIWTQYRDDAGRLVIELPNTRPAAGLAGLAPASGLVESLAVEEVGHGERPLTRLTLATRAEAEHELTSDGELLQLTLLPQGEPSDAGLAITYEPLPAEEDLGETEVAREAAPEQTAPPEPLTAPAAATLAGALTPPPATPEDPYVAPPSTGVRATQVQGIAIRQEGGPVVVVRGDGDFDFASFQLSDPERYVVDLRGVVNTSGQSVLDVDRGGLQRVRIAQFRSEPEAVSRVVLDLDGPRLPALRRTGDGLEIWIDGLSGDGAATWRPAPAHEAVPADREDLVADEPPPAEPSPAEMAPIATEQIVAVSAPPVAPAPVVAAAPAAPRPATDVELFEAMEVQDVVITGEGPVEPERAAEPGFETRDLTAERRYVGEPISFSLRDADIKEVLRTFAKISGLNMVVQPGVSGTVTVELEQVPWDQALEQILKINGLGYELDGNIMRIAPQDQLAREAQQEADRRRALADSVPLKTVLKRVSYAGADSIAQLLRSGATGILSRRGTVAVDGRTNTLIIKELPEFMDTVLAVIDQIDVPEPQVMIEARIIETTKQFSRTLGIAWGFDGVADAAHGNTTGLTFPNNADVEGGVNLLTGGANGFIDLTLGNVLNTFNLDIALQAAENEGLVNILSAPKVATLNNERAEIQSGLQIPVQTVANNTVTVQYVNATLRLAVTPHVTADGTVLLDIQVQKREPQLAFLIAGAASAPISTKEARTVVIVRDGGTTVIGGIYKVTSDRGEDRVPGLANIPLLGNLFKNRRQNSENEELLIFITPRVIKL